MGPPGSYLELTFEQTSSGGGGGGGGGLYGGGGGGSGGGANVPSIGSGSGGGGSSFGTGPGLTNETTTTGPASVTISYNFAGTTTTVISSAFGQPVLYGMSVTFTATVAPPPNGGTVAFTDGGTTISGCGAQPVIIGSNGGATATCTTSALPVGNDSITASYSGYNAYAASSGTVTQPVTQRATTTTLTSSANPSALGMRSPTPPRSTWRPARARSALPTTARRSRDGAGAGVGGHGHLLAAGQPARRRGPQHHRRLQRVRRLRRQHVRDPDPDRNQ